MLSWVSTGWISPLLAGFPPGFEIRVSAGEGEAGGGVNSFHLLEVPDIAAPQWVLSSWFQPLYEVLPEPASSGLPEGVAPAWQGPLSEA